MTALVFALAAAAVVQAPLGRIAVASDRRLPAGTPIEVGLRLAAPPPALTVRRDPSPRRFPAQFDAPARAGDRGVLVFLLPDAIDARTETVFVVEAVPAAPAAASDVALRDDVLHLGHASLEVRTPNAVWTYHKEGAGFGALVDASGHDWITWRPGSGAAGEYRGIPNLGVYAHPGYTGDKGGTTRIESRGPIRARVRSASRSGAYVVVWDFFPRFARLTIEKADVPYWFLYEGTPGGRLDVESDYVVTADGRRRPVSESWSGDLSPEWLYFGDAHQPRVLLLINHQDDAESDQFWQMEGSMTVFGFGREYRCCRRYLTAAPALFTVALAEAADDDAIRELVASATASPEVRVLDR